MRELLGFELRKLLRSRSFYICGGIGILLSVLTVLLQFVLSRLPILSEVGMTETQSALTFARQAISSGELVLMLGIFISIFICSDYGEGTVRIVISRGYSRIKIILARWITVCYATAAVALSAILISFLVGLFTVGIGEDPLWSFFLSVAEQLLVLLAYATIFVCLSTALRKLGAALSLNIVLPMVVPVLTNLIDSWLIARVIDEEVLFSGELPPVFTVTPYLPSGCLGSLSTLSDTNIVSSLFLVESTDLTAIFVRCALVGAAYLVVSFVLTLLAARRQEV